MKCEERGRVVHIFMQHCLNFGGSPFFKRDISGQLLLSKESIQFEFSRIAGMHSVGMFNFYILFSRYFKSSFKSAGRWHTMMDVHA